MSSTATFAPKVWVPPTLLGSVVKASFAGEPGVTGKAMEVVVPPTPAALAVRV